MLMECFIHVKVNFEKKKSDSSLWEISVSCTSQKYHNEYHTLLSILRSIICQLVGYGRLKTKENFKHLAIKVVAGAYERWSLTRGSKYGDLTCKFLVFLENWSLRRGGRNRRFDCIMFFFLRYGWYSFVSCDCSSSAFLRHSNPTVVKGILQVSGNIQNMRALPNVIPIYLYENAAAVCCRCPLLVRNTVKRDLTLNWYDYDV